MGLHEPQMVDLRLLAKPGHLRPRRMVRQEQLDAAVVERDFVPEHLSFVGRVLHFERALAHEQLTGNTADWVVMARDESHPNAADDGSVWSDGKNSYDVRRLGLPSGHAEGLRQVHDAGIVEGVEFVSLVVFLLTKTADVIA